MSPLGVLPFMRRHLFHRTSNPFRRIRVTLGLLFAFLGVSINLKQANNLSTYTRRASVNVLSSEEIEYAQGAIVHPQERHPVDDLNKVALIHSRATNSSVLPQVLQNDPSSEEVLPPLDTLIGDRNRNIHGDVQFLLDFAILGFGKCGTTTLVEWLDSHPEVKTLPKEVLHLKRNRPAQMVYELYDMKMKQKSHHKHSQILQGFKNPSDIRRPDSLAYIGQYWPKTKIIVTVRNPISWFTSLYNFYLNEMKRPKSYLDRKPLIGGPHKNTPYAHTGKGEFHAILSLLGKTPMTTSEEIDLLNPYIRQDERKSNQTTRASNATLILKDDIAPLPNEIFFLDMEQLGDSNATRAAKFRHDLSTFLGLEQDLSPVLHIRPGKARRQPLDPALMYRTCDPQNSAIQRELLKIARDASLWLRKYFLNSEDVIVANREHLEDILIGWMEDPCQDEMRE